MNQNGLRAKPKPINTKLAVPKVSWIQIHCQGLIFGSLPSIAFVGTAKWRGQGPLRGSIDQPFECDSKYIG